MTVDAYLGYSFWLALGALVLNIVNAILATVVIGRIKKEVYATQIVIGEDFCATPNMEQSNVEQTIEQGTDF